MANSYLTRTFGTPTNAYKFTISFWVKRSKLSVSHIAPITAGTYNSTNMGQFLFNSDDILLCQTYNSGGSVTMAQDTNMKFRDTNAWYHIVLAVDGTLGTAGDRQKLYVNGELITSLATDTNASQNTNLAFNQNGIQCMIGNRAGTSYYFDGYMSHVAFVDGQQLTPTTFGETDSTSGIWKFKSPSGITWGNNGFHLKFENSAALGTDSSGEGNDFTVNGNLKQALDTPSNVYCTLNPLAKGDLTNNATLTNGNTYYSSDQSGYNIRAGTLGASKGKWYWEGKFISHNPQTSPGMPLGIIADNIPIGTNIAGGQAPYYYSYTYDGSNGSVTYDSSGTNYGTTILDTIGQIGMVAMDLDNNKVYFGVNGVWTNSANPSNGTGGYSIIDPADTPLGFYLPAVSDRSSIREYVYAWNFGNGYFGTTAITSAGLNGNGSLFEYDVPSGFYALNTKNINTYG